MLGNMSMKPLGKRYQHYQSVVLDAAKEKVAGVLAIVFVLQLLSNLRQKILGRVQKANSDNVLSACLLGKTQNPNDHLHSRVWRYCSKYKNANKNILDFAAAQAVLDYNVGYKEGDILPILGSPLTHIRQSSLDEQDRTREQLRHRKKTYAGGG